MPLPLREAFTARSLGIMWDNYKASLGLAPYLGRTKFGTVKQDSLDLKFIKGKNGLPVALKASNFDAQAPLRDVGGFSDIQNEMPFYRESYMVTEKEEQEYANYQSAENSNMANQVLRQIAKKPMMLIQGAMVVPERQIWELLAPEDGVPKVTVNIEGKKYIVEYVTDDGAAHKKDHFIEISGGEDKWNVPATATPLDDLIQVRRDFAKKTGYSLTRFSMNTETFEMILKAEDTKKQVLGITAYNGGIRVRQADVLSYLREYGIEIEVTIRFILMKMETQSISFRQILFLRSLPEYTSVIIRLEEHRKKEVEVLQTEIFLLLKRVFLFTHIRQTTRLTHIA